MVALHGGEGTPEIVSSFYKNSSNYNHLVQRTRSKADVMVYAPQLILWKDEYIDDPEYRSGQNFDGQLKQLGSSSAALEIFKILRAVDYISANRSVDTSRIGIEGLSYGGFYTMFTAAVDQRFKAALICPRSFCIQIGKQDCVFDYTGAVEHYPKVAAHYEKLGIADSFKFSLRDGDHEFHKNEEDLIWFMERLLQD